jgi:hyperosmotically inducible periplasmic protein
MMTSVGIRFTREQDQRVSNNAGKTKSHEKETYGMKNVALGMVLGLVVSVYPALSAGADEMSPTADNTKQNLQDLDGGEPTAQDQSNKQSALNRTAELRKAIMARKGLSMDAQNIKIIDEDGRVTLRGPVDSIREKTIINTLAEQCLGIQFRNELEIKTQR